MTISDDILLPFSTTLLVRDTCFCMQAQRAARRLARRYDRALRPFGLTNGQFSVLMSLNRPGQAGIADIAQVLGMDRTTVTAILKPLARRGLIASVIEERDRRLHAVLLTSAGRAVLIDALPAWISTQSAVEAALGEPEGLLAGLRSLS